MIDVSVIIPVYNASVFLIDCVKSTLGHDVVKEIILIEDGSTDDSLAKCQELLKIDQRIKLLRHPEGKNLGAACSRNLGISAAGNTYISFLDADDLYTKHRFSKEEEVFNSYPDCDGVYGATGTIISDAVGRDAWEKLGFDEDRLTTVNKYISPADLFDFIIGYKSIENNSGYFHLNSLTLKKQSVIQKAINFNPHLKLHQDSLFTWQICYHLNLYAGELNSAIAQRRVHAQNRYIHNSNNIYSRNLLYQEARMWIRKENLPDLYIDFINLLSLKLLFELPSRKQFIDHFMVLFREDKIFRYSVFPKHYKKVMNYIFSKQKRRG
jgi:glycosyltransferase involved in cell wall biosynthesis